MKERSYEPIHEALKDIYTELEKLPQKHEIILEDILHMTLMTANNTYDAAKFLIKEKNEFWLQAKLLSRFTVELLFNLIFIKQNPSSRTHWFGKVLYKNQLNKIEKIKRSFLNITPQTEFTLSSIRISLASIRRDYDITPFELSNIEDKKR